MVLNKIKGILLGIMVTAGLSTIPALNVTAADIVSSENDTLYESELFEDSVPEFESLNPLNLEEINNPYIDGNYVEYKVLNEILCGPDGVEGCRNEYVYDPATGYLIKYTEGGYDSHSYTYEYDSHGNESRIDCYSVSYYGDATLTEYSVFERTYYGNGNVAICTEKKYRKEGGEFVLDSTETKVYNEDGNCTGSTRYAYPSDYRTIETRYEFIYEGDTLTRENYYFQGKLDVYKIFTSSYTDGVDSYELWTYNYHWDGSMFSSSKEIYVKKQIGDSYKYLLIADYTYFGDKQDDNASSTSLHTYEYDEEGNLLHESSNRINVEYPHYSYEYSEFGNNPKCKLKTKEITYNPDNTIRGIVLYEYYRNDCYDNGHHVPEFDEYDAPNGCVFNYRLYNPNNGEHFYTGSQEEAMHLVELGWNFEGPGFVNPIDGEAVYRLYNGDKGDHIYTMDENEINGLLKEGWTFDGGADWTPAFPSASENTGTPMYRLYNPNAWDNKESGAFHFTLSEDEKDNLVNIGWQYQGIGWYSV